VAAVAAMMTVRMMDFSCSDRGCACRKQRLSHPVIDWVWIMISSVGWNQRRGKQYAGNSAAKSKEPGHRNGQALRGRQPEVQVGRIISFVAGTLAKKKKKSRKISFRHSLHLSASDSPNATTATPRGSAPGVRLMLDDGEEREGAERRYDASRGASDHRGMERGQQRRSVRSQNRSALLDPVRGATRA
jgi:hypothetical protein